MPGCAELRDASMDLRDSKRKVLTLRGAGPIARALGGNPRIQRARMDYMESESGTGVDAFRRAGVERATVQQRGGPHAPAPLSPFLERGPRRGEVSA